MEVFLHQMVDVQALQTQQAPHVLQRSLPCLEKIPLPFR